MNEKDNAAHHAYGNLFLLDLRILVSLRIKSDVRLEEGFYALLLGSFLIKLQCFLLGNVF